jgi:peroxiredoxin
MTIRIAVTLSMLVLLAMPAAVVALDVGAPAPGFTLAATTGGDISLSDFKGKKWVLLEFYGVDFAPT